MNLANLVTHELTRIASPERARTNAWFFKTKPGQYGEGDRFLGVTMPALRKVVKNFEKEADVGDASELLASPLHEIRMAGALLLVSLYKRATTDRERARIYKHYLSFVGPSINNWDLIDVSAAHVIGAHTFAMRDLTSLASLCRDKNMWKRRAGIVATLHWSYHKNSDATLHCAEILLHDKEDLMHKATGWMLREMGKRVSLTPLRTFLDAHAVVMPRTMLRYAIERLPEIERREWLSKRAQASLPNK